MTNLLKVLLLIGSVFISGCSADKNCTKLFTIPSRTIITPSGTSYFPESTFEADCDYVIPPLEEPKILDSFSYEVLSFNFTSDTGKNTSRLQFEIKLNNLSNLTVNGYPVLTTNADDVITTGSYSNGTISNCNQIEAKSSCIYSYDKETPLNINIGVVKSIKLVSVKYCLMK